MRRLARAIFGGALAFVGAFGSGHASCPMTDATKAFVSCESDIDWHDAHAALTDCKVAGVAFRAVERIRPPIHA